MQQQFADKVVLVTGAATGIGAATAVAFAMQGAKVVLADINPVAQSVEYRKYKPPFCPSLDVSY